MFETVLRAVDMAHAHISGRVKEQLGLVFFTDLGSDVDFDIFSVSLSFSVCACVCIHTHACSHRGMCMC